MTLVSAFVGLVVPLPFLNLFCPLPLALLVPLLLIAVPVGPVLLLLLLLLGPGLVSGPTPFDVAEASRGFFSTPLIFPPFPVGLPVAAGVTAPPPTLDTALAPASLVAGAWLK